MGLRVWGHGGVWALAGFVVAVAVAAVVSWGLYGKSRRNI